MSTLSRQLAQASSEQRRDWLLKTLASSPGELMQFRDQDLGSALAHFERHQPDQVRADLRTALRHTLRHLDRATLEALGDDGSFELIHLPLAWVDAEALKMMAALVDDKAAFAKLPVLIQRMLLGALFDAKDLGPLPVQWKIWDERFRTETLDASLRLHTWNAIARADLREAVKRWVDLPTETPDFIRYLAGSSFGLRLARLPEEEKAAVVEEVWQLERTGKVDADFINVALVAAGQSGQARPFPQMALTQGAVGKAGSQPKSPDSPDYLKLIRGGLAKFCSVLAAPGRESGAPAKA